jgi:hypothetical protein
MMTVTRPLWQFLLLVALAAVIGYLFGVLAVWRTGPDPQPARVELHPAPLPPRAVLALAAQVSTDPFPSVPAHLWSDQRAHLDAISREADQMHAEALRLFPYT